MIHQAAVLANVFTFWCFYAARLCRQVLLKEVFKTTFADEADASRVFFGGRYQVVLFGYSANLRLFQLANRKKRHGDLFSADGMQEVALVLVAIKPLQ